MMVKKTFKSITDVSMRQVAETCSELIVENQSDKLKEYIQDLPNHIKIHMIIDDEGYTLLHMAAF